MENIFITLAIIMIAATGLGYLGRWLKQPLVPFYILAGFLLGPGGFAIVKVFNIPILEIMFKAINVTNTDTIMVLSEIGIAFMLFIVGLEIDFKKLKAVAHISSIGGIIQIGVMFAIGFLIAIGFGMQSLEPVYMGMILAFSSTVIVIKLLSDKQELDTLHGRIVVGILLMEDFFAIMAITIITTFDNFAPSVFFGSILKALLIIVIAWLCNKFIFPKMFKFAAKSQELLFLAALAVCFLFSAIFHYIGFSIIIGAFVAGVAIGNLEYNLEIIGKVKSLKDFFITLFFASIGLQLIFDIASIWMMLIALILVVILVKPFIMQVIASVFGYRRKTGFLAAISMTQISEFALIIIMFGKTAGHVSSSMFSMTILLAIITMTVTTYLVKYDHGLYRTFARPLRIFEYMSPKIKKEEEQEVHIKPDVILCGYNRIGFSIYQTMKKKKKKILVIDYNPEIIRELHEKAIPAIYGDVADHEVIDHMRIRNAKMIISTVPDVHDNEVLIKKAKWINPSILVFVTSTQIEEALRLYEVGADYVIIPHILGGEHVSYLIEKTEDVKDLVKTKIEHIVSLKKRKSLY